MPRLKASISYIITIAVQGTDIMASSNLKIKQLPPPEPTFSEVVAQLKGACWIEKGEIYCRAKASKPVFFPNESLKIKLDLDISKSSWGVGHIDYSLFQVVSLVSDKGNRYIRKENLSARNIPGYREEIPIEVNLATLRGNLKDATSTRGSLIEVSYCMEIQATMDSIFAAYGVEPRLDIWFTINPKTEIPKMPKNSYIWKPKIITAIKSSSKVPIFS